MMDLVIVMAIGVIGACIVNHFIEKEEDQTRQDHAEVLKALHALKHHTTTGG